MSKTQSEFQTPSLTGRRPDFQRLVTALNRQEPDLVPFAELIIEPDVRAAFLGRPVRSHADNIEFWACAGYDYYPVAMSIVDPGRSVGGQAAENFSVYAETYTERTWAAMHKGAITSADDFAAYPWPSVDDMDLSVLDELPHLLPDGMQVIVIIGKLFTASWLLQGAETFYLNINAVKERYGDRLALLGNINMDFPLSRGTPADVDKLVAQRIRDLAPGGGYMLSSGNSVAEYIPLENYKAMLLAGHKYGQYPI